MSSQRRRSTYNLVISEADTSAPNLVISDADHSVQSMRSLKSLHLGVQSLRGCIESSTLGTLKLCYQSWDTQLMMVKSGILGRLPQLYTLHISSDFASIMVGLCSKRKHQDIPQCGLNPPYLVKALRQGVKSLASSQPAVHINNFKSIPFINFVLCKTLTLNPKLSWQVTNGKS